MCPAPKQPAIFGTVRLCRPRARRYPFAAVVELTNLQSDENIRQPISDLSLFGCHIIALKPFSRGAKIRVTIVHENASFHAMGKVVHSEPGAGMGVEFTSIEGNGQQILEKWIDKLRSSHRGKPASPTSLKLIP